MEVEEMLEEVCKPQHKKLETEIIKLTTLAEKTHNALCVSNGKPSVISRLEALEKEDSKPDNWLKRNVGIEFKPIESRDIGRFFLGIGVLIIALDTVGYLKPLLAKFGVTL